MPFLDLALDDIVTMKKKHPCGGFDWRVTRLGADIGLVCTSCDRKILIPRAKLESRVKKLAKASDKLS